MSAQFSVGARAAVRFHGINEFTFCSVVEIIGDMARIQIEQGGIVRVYLTQLKVIG